MSSNNTFESSATQPLPIDNSFRWAACPFCGSNELTRVGTVRYAEPIRFSSSTVTLSAPPELWRCQACGSGLIQNTIPANIMSHLYSLGASASRWSARAFADIKTPEVVEAMSEVLRSKPIVVDVGANTGELLDFAKGQGCTTLGVELSGDSRQTLESKGHRVAESLGELDDRSVDVITAFDLVEHLHDFPRFVSDCDRILKPSGHLIILTGDFESLSARLAGAAWWYCSYPEHIAFPSTQVLSQQPGFTSSQSIPTWAAVGYRRAWPKSLFGALARAALGRYRGLPSLGPDHRLHLLKKREN